MTVINTSQLYMYMKGMAKLMKPSQAHEHESNVYERLDEAVPHQEMSAGKLFMPTPAPQFEHVTRTRPTPA